MPERSRGTQDGCSGPASFGGKGMSRRPFLLKHLSYSPLNPFDSFQSWRESTDPTFSYSLDHYTYMEEIQQSAVPRDGLAPAVAFLVR